MSALTDFFKSVAGICRTTPLAPQHWKVTGNQLRVTVSRAPELTKPGGAVYLTGNGLARPVLIVAKDDGGYLCVQNRCTHFWRKLDPVPGEQRLQCCSVNHTTYDFEGNRLSGPGRKPLRIYESDLEDGDLIIRITA